jgi:two-component system response regulator HydG
MPHTILIVDDEVNHAEAIAEVLEREGYETLTAASGEEGLDKLSANGVDLIVTDLVMPGISGMDMMERAKASDPAVEVIMVTAHGSVEQAVQAMEKGAYSFLSKPVNMHELRMKVKRALEKRELVEKADELEARLDKRYGFEGIVARSPKTIRVLETVRQVATTSATVLILGESGTGKELIASAVHQHSPRRDKPFVALNCAALSEGILESELFGHEKGSFTGAVKTREGRFEHADGGTLFLDEVGDMPMATQIKLLRVIEQGEIYRVGSNEPIKVNVRLVAATNQDLQKLIESGEFREDLYFRLKVITLQLPPLRERREEIPPLIDHFIARFSDKHDKPIDGIDPEALKVLQNNPWKGNVRELENCIENMVVVATGRLLSVEDIPPDILHSTPLAAPPSKPSFQIVAGTSLDEMEKQLIRATLKKTGGNRHEAARILKIGERTLYRKLKQYGIE